MSNKRVQVSSDGGTTYVTLPGNQADLTAVEFGNVTDTIFGQTFESQQPTLGQWGVTSNGLFKGVAGYNAVIKQSGTPTSMAAEACSLVSGKTYQVTSTTKRVLSWADALTVLDNAVDHTADVVSIDYLTGKVTFAAGYTVTGPVTLTGYYVPMTQIAKGRSFNLRQSVAQVDTTGYDVAQSNGGFRTFDEGLRSVSLELGGIFSASAAWQAKALTRGIVYVEVDLDASDPLKNVFRGFFKVMNNSQSGSQGDVETQTVQLQLWVPDSDLIVTPFSWTIASASAMSSAVQKVLAAFAAQTDLDIRYLPTGAIGASPNDGIEGTVIVTEASLANSIDGQNEFSFTFRGTGAPAAV